MMQCGLDGYANMNADMDIVVMSYAYEATVEEPAITFIDTRRQYSRQHFWNQRCMLQVRCCS